MRFPRKTSQPGGAACATGPSREAGLRIWVRRALTWMLACALIPAALLVSAEGTLRACHYGQSTRPFLEKECDGQTVFLRNRDFLQQFFTKPIVQANWEKPEFDVAGVKPPGTVRIFVFGSSAALGWPTYDFSFARLLEVMLADAFPGVRFEVCNAAYWGVNSHVMRPMAQACARLQPDIFLVYMGNNEIHGPFGLKTGFKNTAGPPPLPVIRAGIWLGDLRLVQAMRNLSGGHAAPEDAGGQKSVSRPDDPRLKTVYDNYRRNLEDICDIGSRAGARVILSTVGANLRHWAPTDPMHLRPLSKEELSNWDDAYGKGKALQEAGSFPEAAQEYRRAAAIDDTHSDLAYRLGQCCWELGDHDAARAWFVRAMDLDAFDWVRAKTPINNTVLRVAAEKRDRGVALADGAAAIAENSPHGIPGVELFIDSCHLNLEGSYVLARAFFERVIDNLPDSVRSQRQDRPQPASLDRCREALALTTEKLIEPLRFVLNINRELGRESTAVLQAQLAELERQARSGDSAQTLDALAAAVRMPRKDYLVCCEFARTLMTRRSLDAALEQARQLTDAFPYRRGANRLMGQILAEMGKPADALRSFDRTIALYPDDAEAHARRGAALGALGRDGEALAAYDAALARDAFEPVAKCGRGELLVRQGRGEEGRALYRDVIAHNPWAWTAYEKLAASYGDGGAAARVDEFGRLADAYPASPFARLFFGVALEKAGNLDAAIDAFRKAHDIDPLQQPCRISLARTLCEKARREREQGRADQALALYREAKIANPENKEAELGEKDLAR